MDSDTSGSDSRGDIKGDTSGDDAGGDMPYGSTVISSACEALQTASADIRQAMRTVEHPEVRAALANAVETLDGISSDLQGVVGKVLPQASAACASMRARGCDPVWARGRDPFKPADPVAFVTFHERGLDGIADEGERHHDVSGFLGRLWKLVGKNPTAVVVEVGDGAGQAVAEFHGRILAWIGASGKA
jgi:hypothetical protein